MCTPSAPISVSIARTALPDEPPTISASAAVVMRLLPVRFCQIRLAWW
jgi:hypothetical protein